jgi:hypothetical protein
MAAQNVLKLVLVVASVNLLIDGWGLRGAVLVIAVTGAVGKALSLMRVSQLEAISLVDLLPWRSLMTTAAATVFAALLASTARAALGASHLTGLIVALTVFGVSYGAMIHWSGMRYLAARTVHRGDRSANGKDIARHEQWDAAGTSGALAEPRPEGA